jgi:trk system potassium uptake protein TrkH
MPSEGAISGLHFAVRLRVVAKYLGQAFLMLAGLTCVPPNMQRNEALVTTALVFALSAVALAIPLNGYVIPFLDALFESVSGVTTTGLSTLTRCAPKTGCWRSRSAATWRN